MGVDVQGRKALQDFSSVIPIQRPNVASRAFAIHSLLQCGIADSVCRNTAERVWFIWIGTILVFVLIFEVSQG